MTVSNLTKTEESYPNWWKKIWVKEKLLVTTNLSFFHSVFKRLVSQGRQKVSLCGKDPFITCDPWGWVILDPKATIWTLLV